MRIEKLLLRFDSKKNYFFESLTVQFKERHVNFIQGDNGIGKSTLFTILRGNNMQTELAGSIIFDEKTYAIQHNKIPLAFTQQVHYVHQNYDTMVVSHLNVMDNLRMANLPYLPKIGLLPSAKMINIIDSLGIPLDIPVHLLSGGQRQLLAIVMALQKPTSILLLDEPTATLDRKNTYMIINFLYTLVEKLKITILIICHDKELIEEYNQGNSFVMRRMNDGRVVIQARK